MEEVKMLSLLWVVVVILIAITFAPAFARGSKSEQLSAKILKIDKWSSPEFYFILVRDERGQIHEIRAQRSFICPFRRGQNIEIFNSGGDFWRIAA